MSEEIQKIHRTDQNSREIQLSLLNWFRIMNTTESITELMDLEKQHPQYVQPNSLLPDWRSGIQYVCPGGSSTVRMPRTGCSLEEYPGL